MTHEEKYSELVGEARSLYIAGYWADQAGSEEEAHDYQCASEAKLAEAEYHLDMFITNS